MWAKSTNNNARFKIENNSMLKSRRIRSVGWVWCKGKNNIFIAANKNEFNSWGREREREKQRKRQEKRCWFFDVFDWKFPAVTVDFIVVLLGWMNERKHTACSEYTLILKIPNKQHNNSKIEQKKITNHNQIIYSLCSKRRRRRRQPWRRIRRRRGTRGPIQYCCVWLFFSNKNSSWPGNQTIYGTTNEQEEKTSRARLLATKALKLIDNTHTDFNLIQISIKKSFFRIHLILPVRSIRTVRSIRRAHKTLSLSPSVSTLRDSMVETNEF